MKLRKPLFELRGLQPFHDFPEGPDWWTQDDWLSVVNQAVKMRMNFIGLHTYPFHNKDLGPEPTVWVGLPEDVNADGTVKAADHASWYTTAKFMPYGCYRPMKTGDYSFGGAEVFPADNYGPEIERPGRFPDAQNTGSESGPHQSHRHDAQDHLRRSAPARPEDRRRHGVAARHPG